MKTRFLVTTELEIEHDDCSTVDPRAVTEAANVGAQALANESLIINSVTVRGRSRPPKKVTATPRIVVTASNGHRHELNMQPWSDRNVRPEEAIGQICSETCEQTVW